MVLDVKHNEVTRQRYVMRHDQRDSIQNVKNNVKQSDNNNASVFDVTLGGARQSK